MNKNEMKIGDKVFIANSYSVSEVEVLGFGSDSVIPGYDDWTLVQYPKLPFGPNLPSLEPNHKLFKTYQEAWDNRVCTTQQP